MELEEQQIGAVLHCSRRVYCAARRRTALASIVERTDTNGAVRFVLWCSLRSAGECDEQCLRCEQRDGQPQATTGYGKRIVIAGGKDANPRRRPTLLSFLGTDACGCHSYDPSTRAILVDRIVAAQ